MLSEQAIKEFSEIYQKEFGILLTHQEAAEKATALLLLYSVVIGKPLGEVYDRQKN